MPFKKERSRTTWRPRSLKQSRRLNPTLPPGAWPDAVPTGTAAPAAAPRRRASTPARDRTLDEVAAETLISTSKLSRLENGQGVPQPRDIRDLINFYDADRRTSGPHQSMDERRVADRPGGGSTRTSSSDSADVVPRLRVGASVIRTYAPMVLPGLLQTEAVTPQAPDDEPFRIARPSRSTSSSQVRMRRQQILLDDDRRYPAPRRHRRGRLVRARAMGSPDEAARASLFISARSRRRSNVSDAHSAPRRRPSPRRHRHLHRLSVRRRHRPRRRPRRGTFRRPLLEEQSRFSNTSDCSTRSVIARSTTQALATY